MLAGNSEFNARADATTQAPVYYATVSGIGSTLYATAPISSPSGTVKLILGQPSISPGGLDLLDGSWTVSRVRLPFYDVAGEASILFGIGGASAPVTTWKNRTVSLYGGYRDLAYAFYVRLFTGRVVGLRMLPDAAGYELELADSTYLLDGELFTKATAAKPTTLRGNVVNVFMSILRGVFSTGDADFPLDAVSTDTGSTSAPTGLSIPDSLLDFVGVKAERDLWRPGDVVELELEAPEAAREYLRREFFRTFQARLTLLGSGVLGMRFNLPALPASAAPIVDLTTTSELIAWEHLHRDHLNKFRVRGDFDIAAGTFADLYAGDPTEDTADRTATGETVEYVVESKWLRAAYDGAGIAAELVGRLRQLWLEMPCEVKVAVNFRQRRLEPGDVVAVTHPDLPNLRSSTRGLEGRLMTVIRAEPDLVRGRIVLELLDGNFRRFGVIAPDAVSANYAAATAAERETFWFTSNSSGQMADGSPGYRFI